MFVGQPKYLDRVGERARDRLVDEHGLTGREDRPDLFQVLSPVDAQDHDHIDLLQQFIDRVDDLHAQFGNGSHLRLQQFHALRDIRAASGITGHHGHVGQFSGRLRIIDDLRPRQRVCIQADDAGFQWHGPLIRTHTSGQCRNDASCYQDELN